MKPNALTRFHILLIAAALLCLAAPPSPGAESAVLGPALQDRLRTAVPWEPLPVILKFTATPRLEPLARLPEPERRKAIVQVLRLTAQAKLDAAEPVLQSLGADRMRPLWIVNAVAFRAPPHVIEEAVQLPGVQRILLDATVSAPEPAAAPAGTPEWNIDAVGAPVLWALGPGFTGQGVTVATVDTGADVDHPDLVTRWRGGANSWLNTVCDDPGVTDACDLNCDTPCDASSDPLTAGHGTGVMGILVGGDAGGTAIGVAPGAQWIAAKVFDADGLAWVSDILEAFQWILDPDGDPQTDDAPQVVNNSWGFDSRAGTCVDAFDLGSDLESAVNTLRQAGIAMVFSAGNTGPSAASSVSPANYAELFSVGSVNQESSVSLFSSRGPGACTGNVYPSVVAPGSGVLTAGVLQDYLFDSGTSFAAPHAAGALALLMEAFPDRPATELEWAVKASAADLGIPGPDNSAGFGLVNVVEAYNLLAASNGDFTVAPLASDFGIVTVGTESLPQAFVLTNQGPTDRRVQDVFIAGSALTEFFPLDDRCTGMLLEPGAGCSVTVVFRPLSEGPKGATLAFALEGDPVLPAPLVSGNAELCAERFADVPADHWAFGYVHTLFCNGVTTGCSLDGPLFCPDGAVTREQMAAFIVRALEGEPPEGLCDDGGPFPDVPPLSWSCKYIQRLFESGITTGFQDGTFRPLDPVTREQVAAFLVRALGEEPAPDTCQGTSPFVDVPPESWSCGYISRISELGITKGTGDGTTFEPQRITTRAETAAFIARAFLSMD